MTLPLQIAETRLHRLRDAGHEVVVREGLSADDLLVEIGSANALIIRSATQVTPEVLERATEPFFTTKGPGRGMGMGLFLARALAEQLGGQLRLVSSQGAGTSATIELPARCLAAEPGGRRV